MTYSSLGRTAWSRTTSSRVISAVPSPSGSCPIASCVDAGGVEPPAPCLSRRCAAVAPRVVGGPGSVRTSPCRVSTGRSTVRASGPLCLPAFLSNDRCDSGTPKGVEPAAGIEPAPSRVRAERPSLRTSPACWSGRRGSNPRLRLGGPTCCHLTPRPPGFGGPARPSPGGTLRRAAVRSPCSSGPGAACGEPRPGRTGRP